MFTTNAQEIQAKYARRAQTLQVQAMRKPRQFALALHELRKANLDKLIYQKSPYRASMSGNLKQGEKIQGDKVFNSVPYAGTRAKMKGNYAGAAGTSKDADWGKISFQEILPVVRAQEVSLNRMFIRGA